MVELKLIDCHGYVVTEKYPENRLMMATLAQHLLGDISNKMPSLCVVLGEHNNPFTREYYYVGCWYGGHCFNVRFPKETTRDLNPEEQEILLQDPLRLTGVRF